MPTSNLNIRKLRRSPARNAMFNTRWKTNWLARVLTPQGPLACIIEDISAGGAKLRIGNVPLQPSEVSLVIVDVAAIAGRIAWYRGGRIGLALVDDQPQVMELVIKAAKANHWQAEGLPGRKMVRNNGSSDPILPSVLDHKE